MERHRHWDGGLSGVMAEENERQRLAERNVQMQFVFIRKQLAMLSHVGPEPEERRGLVRTVVDTDRIEHAVPRDPVLRRLLAIRPVELEPRKADRHSARPRIKHGERLLSARGDVRHDARAEPVDLRDAEAV